MKVAAGESMSTANWQGAKVGRAVGTLALGLLLYFGLPKVAPVPDAKAFAGQPAPAAPAKESKPALNPAAPPAALSEAESKAKAEADIRSKSEAEAKAKAAAEEKRRADWVTGLHLFAIFVTTIVGIILKPLPMGAVAMIAMGVTAVSGTLSIADSLSGFSDVVIWLIVLAFFISRGFVKTGLGARIAYNFMALLGRQIGRAHV